MVKTKTRKGVVSCSFLLASDDSAIQSAESADLPRILGYPTLDSINHSRESYKGNCQ